MRVGDIGTRLHHAKGVFDVCPHGLLMLVVMYRGSGLALDEVHDLIVSGGQVISDGLPERLEAARLIVCGVTCDNQMVACIALKDADESHTRGVFTRAGVPRPESSLEVGWCVVAPEYRGKGISGMLLHELVVRAPDKNLHATSDPNSPMARTLRRYGFQQVGSPWRSELCHDREIALHVR